MVFDFLSITTYALELMVGIPKQTLLYYEKEGLITVARDDNNYRNYSQNNIEILKLIKLLREMEISIDEIKLILDNKLSIREALEKKKEFIEHNKIELDNIDQKINDYIKRNRVKVSFNNQSITNWVDKETLFCNQRSIDYNGIKIMIDEIKEICDKHNVPLVEDAAESLGATYKGKQTGTFGKYGIYSFNGNKIITTSGGGMLISDDEERIAKVRFWSTQSREKARHYEHKEIGYNYRMSNIVAGIGRGQLKVLDERLAQKKHIYDTYKEGLKDISDIEMAPVPKDSKPSFWLSVLTLKENSKVKPIDIMEALEKENIETRPVWKPMHMQPVFKDYDFIKVEGEPVSTELFENGVCLPSDTKMSDVEQSRVIEIIKNLWK